MIPITNWSIMCTNAHTKKSSVSVIYCRWHISTVYLSIIMHYSLREEKLMKNCLSKISWHCHTQKLWNQIVRRCWQIIHFHLILYRPWASLTTSWSWEVKRLNPGDSSPRRTCGELAKWTVTGPVQYINLKIDGVETKCLSISIGFGGSMYCM